MNYSINHELFAVAQLWKIYCWSFAKLSYCTDVQRSSNSDVQSLHKHPYPQHRDPPINPQTL